MKRSKEKESRDYVYRTGGFKSRSSLFVLPVLVLIVSICITQPTFGVDAENCLMCHRYPGLARVDKEGKYRLFYVDEELFLKGPHARVTCKGCHVDIEKYPHNDAQAVDCLRSCHIEEPTREIVFTHAGVKESLNNSAHSPVKPDGAPAEHAEDYPDCKDCHDMPLFRPVAMFKKARSGVSEHAVERCLVCHSDEHFVRYYYSHVTTRLHKARDPREVVTMCASCHGDAEFARRHGLPDVVSSYLETFHGKAVLLGSAEAPDCIDCHAGHENVHAMQASENEESAVHASNRAEMCSREDCHGAAGPALASFDVHATRNPASHKLEFGVALFFVIMTLAILGPILTLNMLGLIRELFPSHEAEVEVDRLTGLAQARAKAEDGIQRFSGSQRLQHAILVVLFVILCLTGLPLKFPESEFSQAIFELLGGISVAPIIHRVAGVSMLIGFALHVSWILYDVKKSVNEKNEKGAKAFFTELTSRPMIPRPSDLKELIAYAKYVFYISPHKPNYGRFCWKEKLEYLGLFWGITLLGITGFLLWGETVFTRHVPGWLLNIAYLAHTYESILALAHIALVHIPEVIGRPGMSLVSSMVIDGKISPLAQGEEHGAEVIEWARAEEKDK